MDGMMGTPIKPNAPFVTGRFKDLVAIDHTLIVSVANGKIKLTMESGLRGGSRVSVYFYLDSEDADRLLKAVEDARRLAINKGY